MMDQGMTAGADGIFLDEVPADALGANLAYCSAVAGHVRSLGGIAVVNPGSGSIDESWMPVADVVCLECGWDATQFTASWKSKYEPRRFWGLDGDCRPVTSAAAAAADTTQARANGVGLFYATDLYVNLPSWFEAYVQSPGFCALLPAMSVPDL